jgi:hypothetical protein
LSGSAHLWMSNAGCTVQLVTFRLSSASGAGVSTLGCQQSGKTFQRRYLIFSKPVPAQY